MKRNAPNPFHLRNQHSGHYDFDRLIDAYPPLSQHLTLTPRGEQSIDFANSESVTALNRALLERFYGVKNWELPAGYLCPAIPGRSDYVHYLADLLALGHDGTIPRGDSVRALDVGVGSSCIYPIIGRSEYGWSFVGSDIDHVALDSSARILRSNPKLAEGIELRLQRSPTAILKNVIATGEFFDVVICNPPFHSSLQEAQTGTRRKWRNLGRAPETQRIAPAPALNFGGQASELWCEGGEAVFIDRMIQESVGFANQVHWFSTLLSKSFRLPGVYQALGRVGAVRQSTVEMGQGQKKSRFVAWSFAN